MFGASGVQKAKCVPCSTIRTAPALGWLSRNLELLLDVSSFPERKAPLTREVVRARSVAQHRNTGGNAQTCQKQPNSPCRGSVQVALLMSQGSRSISAIWNPTGAWQQWVAPGLELEEPPDSARRWGGNGLAGWHWPTRRWQGCGTAAAGGWWCCPATAVAGCVPGVLQHIFPFSETHQHLFPEKNPKYSVSHGKGKMKRSPHT